MSMPYKVRTNALGGLGRRKFAEGILPELRRKNGW